jgi:hypothetical protein
LWRSLVKPRAGQQQITLQEPPDGGRSDARPGGAVTIDAVVARMTVLLDELTRAGDARAAFHATYLRTTRAVADALRAGDFLDADWVERWDVAFARL